WSTQMSQTEVTLRYPGGELTMPVTQATDGQSGIDISNLLKETGYTTLDPGYGNTGACTSSITYIDGDAGILRYRGYPIEQLAEQRSFRVLSYLLVYAELPPPSQLAEFSNRVRRHTMLHADMGGLFQRFPKDPHPLAVLSSAVRALSTFSQDSLNPLD